MIYLSAILVVLAFGLLVAGVVTGTAVLVMWSIVVSVLSAVFLMIGALLRRHELFPSGGTTAATAPPMPVTGAGVAGGSMGRPGGVASPGVPPRGAPLAHPMAAPHPGFQTATLAPPRAFPATGPVRGTGGGPSSDAIVLVIPGRKRFHLRGCRQLAGREFEELTYEEAREEGFTACTTCLPDGYTADTARRSETVRIPEPTPRTTDTGHRSEPGDSPETGTGHKPGSQAGAKPEHQAESRNKTKGQAESRNKTEGQAAETGRGPASGYRSDETRPVPQLPAKSPMDPIEKTPGRAGTSTGSSSSGSSAEAETERPDGEQFSTWQSEAWFATPSSGSSTDKPSTDSPSGSSSSKPGASSSAKKPGASSKPIDLPVTPVKLPEAVTPFEAFKRSDLPKPSAGTSKPSAGTSKPSAGTSKPSAGDARPGEPGSGKPRTASSDPSSSAGKPGLVGKKPVEAHDNDNDDDPVVVVSGALRPSDTPGKTDMSGKDPDSAKSAGPGRSTETGKTAGPAKGAGSPAPGKSAEPEKATATSSSAGSAEASPKPAAPAEKPPKPQPDGGSTQRSDADVKRGDTDSKSRRTDVKPGDTDTTSSDAGGRPSGAGDKPRKSDSTVEVMRPGIVKVIPGTRRYHSSACPLIKGSDPGTLETMSKADAEAAGLTHCSVCDRDDD
ncbi:hypothetical protein ACOZ38_30820 [Sphaerisporangium viridialbum]|uniref:hypothetical protein n=1 Tax=Sphaerisporangium viridialbum TaxID=46189 RepID=UPI003C787C58